MQGRQFRHLPGADEHAASCGHLAEDAFGQFHGGIAHRHGAGADAGGGADLLRHGKGLVAQPVDDDARGRLGHGVAVGRLELAEDLGFAEDQGIEARGHAEQVFHGVHALMGIEMRGQAGRVLTAHLGPGRQDVGFGIAVRYVGHQHLHPVAGGKHQGLA